MGDVAMSVPVLRAFRAQNPDVKLTVLTREKFAPLFRNIDNLSVYSADLNGKHKGILGLRKLSKELKTLNFDAVADLHNVLRTSILKLFLPKPFARINKGRSEKKALINGNFKPLKSTHQRYAEVFKQLGFNVSLDNPLFPKKLQIPPALANELNISTKNKTKKWIGIAPFAAYESKMYPLSKMRNVVAELSKDYHIFLFGGGDNEVIRLNEIAESNNDVFNLAGRLNLEDELNIISNLDLMIAMDSSNGHLAAMLGKKVLTIWGVTHPYAGFKPFNQPIDYQIVVDRKEFPLIPTSIYGNKYPEDYKDAAGSISINEIVDKVRYII